MLNDRAGPLGKVELRGGEGGAERWAAQGIRHVGEIGPAVERLRVIGLGRGLAGIMHGTKSNLPSLGDARPHPSWTHSSATARSASGVLHRVMG
jgi:hypothetical protein